MTSLAAEQFDARTVYEDLMRMWSSPFAAVLISQLRCAGLADTDLAAAQVGTIRVRLLEIGAQVRWSVRQVHLAFSSAFPRQVTFARALRANQEAFG